MIYKVCLSCTGLTKQAFLRSLYSHPKFVSLNPKYNLWLCHRREVAQWRRLKVLLGRLEQSLGFATAWLPLYLLFIYVLVNFHHRRCCFCARTCFPETLWRLLKQKRLLSILITILCLTSERNLHEFGCDVAVFSFLRTSHTGCFLGQILARHLRAARWPRELPHSRQLVAFIRVTERHVVRLTVKDNKRRAHQSIQIPPSIKNTH